jgi:CRISPR system Cascade subunit CasE
MTLFASVLRLDRQAVKALHITDPYSLHRVVYSLFDDVRSDVEKSASQSSGILYADQGGDIRGRNVLLLSNRQPLACVENQYGEVESRIVTDDFLNHERYRFKVIINPTRRDNASGKLRPIKGRGAIHQWFSERAPKSWGFQPALENLQIDHLDVLQFMDKAQRPVTLAQAHVQGMLTVTDHQAFELAFQHGIGRGHAFGCGLLQIVPLIDSLSN